MERKKLRQNLLAHLKKLVAGQALDNSILTEAARENLKWSPLLWYDYECSVQEYRS